MRIVLLLPVLVVAVSCHNSNNEKSSVRDSTGSQSYAPTADSLKNPDTTGVGDFVGFWEDFKMAVLNADTNKIIAMTAFPFETRGPDDNDSTFNYNREKFTKVFQAFLQQWDGGSLEGNTELHHIKTMQGPQKGDVYNNAYARMGNLCFEKNANGWKLVFAYLGYDTIDLLNK